MFTDKTREAQRVAALAADKQKQIKEERALQVSERTQQKQKNGAWSKRVSKKQEKETRKEKRNKKRQWLKAQAAESESGPNDGSALKRAPEEDGDDWDELAREERMIKKVKRGEVDSEEFEREFGGL